MIRLGTVVLGTDDVGRAVAFWESALGYDRVEFPDAGNGFTILRHPTGEGTRVALQRSERPADPEPRLHIDLVVESAEEQASEIERLVGLGASRVEWNYPDDPDFVVLADTEQNRFCIVNAGHRSTDS